jgi:hypothetical protein
MAGPYRGDETLLAIQTELFRWNAPVAGMTLFDTVVGTLAVTNQRVLFLSTGEHGLTGQFTVLGKLVTGERVDHVDFAALANTGSIDLPLDRVRSLEVKRRWDFASYLTMLATSETGRPLGFAFMSKIGLNRSELERIAVVFQTAKRGGT